MVNPVGGGSPGALKITFGNHELVFTRRRVWGVVACLVVGILGLVLEGQESVLTKTQWQYVPLIGKVAYSVAFVVLGLVIAPTARAANHSVVASVSVERLYEMHRSVKDVAGTVTDAVNEIDGDMRLPLMMASFELQKYPDVLLKTAADWEEVVPEVAKTVSERRVNRQAILDEMERGENNG